MCAAVAGLSEDSDYTSEVNYPLAQHHEANGSASQYLSVAHQYPSPQRSSEISRENSYETNDTSTDQRHWAYDYGGGGYQAQVSPTAARDWRIKFPSFAIQGGFMMMNTAAARALLT